MDFLKQMIEFIPNNDQEKQDKELILSYIEQFPDSILLRDNRLAHITSSGFIMNEQLNKVLLVHHNIRSAWAWTGGHVDGDADFLHVAIKEAKEETGINDVAPLSRDIISVDILPVYGHMKKSKYISAHLHLSVAYILIASEKEALVVNEEENSGVCWFEIDRFTREHFDANDFYLYGKLIQRAKQLRSSNMI